jgi:hypothetical protein
MIDKWNETERRHLLKRVVIGSFDSEYEAQIETIRTDAGESGQEERANYGQKGECC